MQNIITSIVSNDTLHAKWLNTLSYLENVGARKIAACQNPYMVDLTMLKHAAEEHRHAYYLKKQLHKLNTKTCEYYDSKDFFAPILSKQYLQKLDLASSHYLKEIIGVQSTELRFLSYLFVTYAIELRADVLYPMYQEVLSRLKSKVMVKSIIIEEEGHLEEMIHMLSKFDNDWQRHISPLLKLEEELFSDWFKEVSKEVVAHESFARGMAD